MTVTIPADLVRTADDRARALERSRSWVVADALRRGLAAGPGEPDAAAGRRKTAGDADDWAARLGPSRVGQLDADLRLSPEVRVREAERTARVTELRARRRAGARVLSFDRYEDYLEWQRQDDLAG